MLVYFHLWLTTIPSCHVLRRVLAIPSIHCRSIITSENIPITANDDPLVAPIECLVGSRSCAGSCGVGGHLGHEGRDASVCGDVTIVKCGGVQNCPVRLIYNSPHIAQRPVLAVLSRRRPPAATCTGQISDDNTQLSHHGNSRRNARIQVEMEKSRWERSS